MYSADRTLLGLWQTQPTSIYSSNKYQDVQTTSHCFTKPNYFLLHSNSAINYGYFMKQYIRILNTPAAYVRPISQPTILFVPRSTVLRYLIMKMAEGSIAETSVNLYLYTWRHLPRGLNVYKYNCDCLVSELSTIHLESKCSGITKPGAVTVPRIVKGVNIDGKVKLNACIHLKLRLRLAVT